MAWTAPDTWTSNQVITASALNRMRDNFNETAVAKATTAGSHFAATGVNAIAERLILQDIVDTSESTASTSFVSLTTAGPTVTITTGIRALIWITASMSNTGSSTNYASYDVSGATTYAANSDNSLTVQNAASNDVRASSCALQTMTAGSNTVNMKYRTTGGTVTVLRRRLAVMGL